LAPPDAGRRAGLTRLERGSAIFRVDPRLQSARGMSRDLAFTALRWLRGAALAALVLASGYVLAFLVGSRF
jgi:hypothetical protein